MRKRPCMCFTDIPCVKCIIHNYKNSQIRKYKVLKRPNFTFTLRLHYVYITFTLRLHYIYIYINIYTVFSVEWSSQLLWTENISLGMLCGIRDFWIDVTPSPLGALFLFSHLFYKIQSLGTRGKRSLINIVLVISDMVENGQFRPKWPYRKWPKSCNT